MFITRGVKKLRVKIPTVEKKGLEHVGDIVARLVAENPEGWGWLFGERPRGSFIEAPGRG